MVSVEHSPSRSRPAADWGSSPRRDAEPRAAAATLADAARLRDELLRLADAAGFETERGESYDDAEGQAAGLLHLFGARLGLRPLPYAVPEPRRRPPPKEPPPQPPWRSPSPPAPGGAPDQPGPLDPPPAEEPAAPASPLPGRGVGGGDSALSPPPPLRGQWELAGDWDHVARRLRQAELPQPACDARRTTWEQAAPPGLSAEENRALLASPPVPAALVWEVRLADGDAPPPPPPAVSAPPPEPAEHAHPEPAAPPEEPAAEQPPPERAAEPEAEPEKRLGPDGNPYTQAEFEEGGAGHMWDDAPRVGAPPASSHADAAEPEPAPAAAEEPEKRLGPDGNPYTQAEFEEGGAGHMWDDAPRVGAPPREPERRLGPDGEAYTKEQFIEGGAEHMWDDAPPAPGTDWDEADKMVRSMGAAPACVEAEEKRLGPDGNAYTKAEFIDGGAEHMWDDAEPAPGDGGEISD